MITTMDTLLIALVLLLLGSQLVLFHKLRKVHLASYRLLQAADETFSLFQQFQSYDSLMRLIEPARPLPALRRWAASPDLLLTLAKEVLDRKPEAILECSSGSTTLVLARCCQLNSSGHVTSLEHDEKFAIQTREWLAEHGLERWATVIHAPLRPTGKTGQPWYDLSHLEIPENGFDMLVIDGPPVSVARHARYPAIPELDPILRKGARIIMDDAARRQEQEILQLWTQAFPNYDHTALDLEKGAALLIKG